MLTFASLKSLSRTHLLSHSVRFLFHILLIFLSHIFFFFHSHIKLMNNLKWIFTFQSGLNNKKKSNFNFPSSNSARFSSKRQIAKFPPFRPHSIQNCEATKKKLFDFIQFQLIDRKNEMKIDAYFYIFFSH